VFVSRGYNNAMICAQLLLTAQTNCPAVVVKIYKESYNLHKCTIALQQSTACSDCRTGSMQ